MEPIIAKILYGLIASSVLGMFVTIMARMVEKKAKDLSVSKALGTLFKVALTILLLILFSDSYQDL